MAKQPQKVDRATFIAAHPQCCYCDGKRATVELDHAPARICFIKKHGPEGYIFPSCSECNRAAALSEQVMAFYIRSFDTAATDLDEVEFSKLVDGLVNNAPDAVPSLPQRAGIGPGLLIHVPSEAERTLVIPPIAKDHIDLFATKVLYALYYKVTGKRAGTSNRRIVRWAQTGRDNSDLMLELADKWFDEHAVGKRANVDLGNQFTYQTGYHSAHGFFGVRMSFGGAFVMFGVIGPAREMAKLQGEKPLCRSIFYEGNLLRKRSKAGSLKR